MGAVWMCARADTRRRWVSAVVLTLLIAVVGAVVLTAVAGARRTSSAYDRFLTESRAADLYIFPGEVTPAKIREFADVPSIAAIGAGRTLQALLADGDFLNAGVPIGPGFGTKVERARIIDGRAAHDDAPDEVVISEPLARRAHLRVGDTLPLRSFTPAQVDALRSGASSSFPEPAGPSPRLRVVGINRLPSDLSLSGARGGILVFSRAFRDRYGSEIGSYSGDVLAIRVNDPDADIPRVLRRARHFFGSADTFDFQPLGEGTAGVQQSMDMLALGALVFAAVAAIAGLAAVGFALRRRMDADVDDERTLGALGLTRGGRALVVGLPAVPIVVAGAVLAVLGAWLASPLMPMGLARKAEPDPGVHFDALVLGSGLVVLVAVLAVVAAVIAWRMARVAPSSGAAERRPSVVARTAERAGLAPSASIGTRAALEGRTGRARVPVRSALIVTAAAVIGIVTVSVFGTSLHQLETTPELFGYNWDARVTGGVARPVVPDHPCTVEHSKLTAVRGVGAVASVCSLNVEVGNRPMVTFGLTPIRGVIDPTIVDGRAPRAADEVALGTHTLAALGLEIGDHVDGAGPDGPVTYRIVGTAAAPRLNDDFSDPVPVDDGAFFTGRGLDALDDPTDEDSDVETVIRVAPGADRATVLRRVERVHGVRSFDGGPGVTTAAVPLEVERLRELDSLPLVLAGFLAVLGVISVGFVLVTSVRRRRRDLAILKTLGFRRRQVSATVAWQATTMAIVGLMIGVPLGLVAGRAIWRSVATDLGVVSTPEVAVGLLVVIGLATIAIANLIAALPARAAARTRPALVLRSE